MKTVFINCSPKKNFSASSYFISLQKIFVKGEKVVEKLRNKGDYQRVLDAIKDADNVVFSLPLYIDCLPSHVLPFLKEAETMCKENGIKFNVYSIINNGFIEGCQSEPVLRILKNFSDRAGLTFCGGIGIGGGVMLNVTRIIFLVQIGIFVLNLVLNFIQNGFVFPLYLVLDFLKSAGIILFFNAGVLLFISRMGFKINKSKYFGKKYTRILIPSFIFIIFADIFFIVISVFQGGIFRGLFSKKQPDDITISKEN